MPSKFGGVPVEQPAKRSKFGGVAVSAPAEKAYNPTDEMSGYERFMAGAGKSVVDSVRGTYQAAVDGMDRNLGGIDSTLRVVGANRLADYIGRRAGVATHRKSDQLRLQEQARREADAPLMSTAGGLGGNVAGNVAQLIGPGLAVRGTGAAAVVMPRTLAGLMAQGGTMGYLQPVTSDSDRVMNTSLGAAAGAAGAAVPKVLGAAARTARNATVTTKGAARRAVDVIRREAANPDALLKAEQSAVPGVTRTLFEETLDPGIARLETKSRGTVASWTARDKANNAARVQAIEAFAGDKPALREAVSQRNASTSALRQRAMQDAGVDTGPVRTTIADLIEQNRTRPSVANSLRGLLSESLDYADDGVQSLYGVRKHIDDVLTGKTDSKVGQAASAELLKVKSVLDDQIKQASPAFGNYLSDFIEKSRPIDRMKVGQELLRRGSGRMLDPDTGKPMLMPGQFGGAVKDLDALAARATKFRQADAASTLRPQDLATINAVTDDLSRQSQRLPLTNGGGSQTDSLAEVGQRTAANSLLRMIPGGGALMEHLDRIGARHLENALAEVLQNPARYREIAAQLSAQDQRVLEDTLARAGALSATGTALSEQKALNGAVR